jgi:HSP20 family molecular chaperone IbpA
MIRTLLSMLNDERLYARFAKTANGLREAYSNVMNNINSTFVEEDGNYVYSLNVPTELTSADVNVEYDDETKSVTVEIEHKHGNTSYKMTTYETLPSDANIDTMSATVVNGVFTIVVEKLPEPEPEAIVEPSVDPIKVVIKKKNK